MNMKKLVSSVAAFAMTASVFAGLAVTANASDYEIDEVLYGVNTNGTVTVQTDFAGDANEVTDVADSVFAGTKFLEGSRLAGSKGITKSFTEPVKSGKVHFAVGYTVLGGNTNHIRLVGSDGSTVVGLYPQDSSATNTINVVQIGDAANSAYVYTPRNVAYNVDVTLDLDLKTYSGTITCCSGGSSGTVNKVTPTKIEGVLNGVTDIAGLSTKANAQYAYYMDNIMLYNEKTLAQLYNYEINYTLGGETVKQVTGSVPENTVITADKVFVEGGTKYYITADEAPTLTVSATGENVLDVPVRLAKNCAVKVVPSTNESIIIASKDVIEGESWSYSYPAYLTDENNKVLASASVTTYNGSIVPTNDEIIKIPYTAYDGDAWFFEGEAYGGDGTYINDGRLSGGIAVRHISEARASYKAISVVVPEAGIYTVTVRGVTSNSGKGSSLSVYVNDTEGEAIDTLDIDSASVNKILTQSKEEVSLNAGDKIIVKGAEDNSGCDYILLKKTADLEVEEPEPEVKITQIGDLFDDVTDDAPAAAWMAKITPAAGSDAISGLTWKISKADGTSAKVDHDVALSGTTEIVIGLVIEIDEDDVSASELTVEMILE